MEKLDFYTMSFITRYNSDKDNNNLCQCSQGVFKSMNSCGWLKKLRFGGMGSPSFKEYVHLASRHRRSITQCELVRLQDPWLWVVHQFPSMIFTECTGDLCPHHQPPLTPSIHPEHPEVYFRVWPGRQKVHY